jgi:hypothetical protein
MLLEQSTHVKRDKITTAHNLAVPTSPRILRHGDLTERHALLNYRAFIYSACEDSFNDDTCYLQNNSYSHF